MCASIWELHIDFFMLCKCFLFFDLFGTRIISVSSAKVMIWPSERPFSPSALEMVFSLDDKTLFSRVEKFEKVGVLYCAASFSY